MPKNNFLTNSRLSAGLSQRSMVWKITLCWDAARKAKMHHGFLCDTHSNYELQIIWEHPTPAAAMLILCPARPAKSVGWWLAGEASNSCTLSVSHKIPWIQAWKIPAEVRRVCFDSRGQNQISFTAMAHLEAVNVVFFCVHNQEIR